MSLVAWPWRLGLLLDEELSDEHRRALAEEVFATNNCCVDAFTASIKATVQSPDQLLSAEKLRMLNDIFRNIPVTNIGSEHRFASAHVRMQRASGNVGAPASLAADHVLGEAKMVLDSGLACGAQFPHTRLRT